MSEKREALRLADEIDTEELNMDRLEEWLEQAAAELRRQHEEITELRHGAGVAHQTIAGLVAQRDALKQTLHDELAGNLRLRDLGCARPDEPMLTFLERIIAERDALLEALKAMLLRDEKNTCRHEETHRGGAIWEICDSCGAMWADDKGGKPEWEDPKEWVQARAAIKAVEEGK